MLSSAFRLGLVVWVAASALHAQSGYDSAGYPAELVKRLGLEQERSPAGAIGVWLRLRGFPHAPVGDLNDAEVQKVRVALGRLRDAGYKSVALLRWDPKSWSSPPRSTEGRGNRAPLDLREAYTRARAFADTYGDLVDAWEFENEPDIGYFADNADVVAAYYKAVALGIAAGRERCRAGGSESGAGSQSGALAYYRTDVDSTAGRLGGGDAEASWDKPLHLWTPDRRSGLHSAAFQAPGSTPPARSLVVMPAMGLPPGPYLEQLLANGFLSYTEGVNLHFYGFPEDYGAAHDRLREALGSVERGAGSGEQRHGPMERQGDSAVGGGLAEVSGPRASGFRTTKVGLFPNRLSSPSGLRLVSRRLPVFVTEWGYPRLDGYDAQTVEGRVRQWRYFRAGQKENRRRAVAAPMAFYLSPYFEIGAKEFGLPMPQAERRTAHYGFPAVGERQGAGSEERGAGRNEGRRSETGEDSSFPASGSPVSDIFQAGGLRFVPEDFGMERAEQWMRRIGARIGGDEASPALAWLMEEGAGSKERGAVGDERRAERAGHFRSPVHGHPAPAWKGDWLLRTEVPSPVVIDFVAGEGTVAIKRFNGYLLSEVEGNAGAHRQLTGRGVLVFYNFGTVAAEVRLPWPAEMHGESGSAEEAHSVRVTLAPGERREVPVRLNVDGSHFAPRALSLEAQVSNGPVATVSRWATSLYPAPQGLAVMEGRSFSFPAESARKNRRWLETRLHAAEELRLHAQPDGRWRTTKGVRVEETNTGWRFHVEALPGAYLSPAVVELPLPDDWAPWERGLVLDYNYRVEPGSFASRTPLRPNDPDARRRLQVASNLGDMIESYLRTETGALYSTVPRLFPRPEWQRYSQTAETLTAFFPGRLAAPLRAEKERPAALVFYLRPIGLPTTFEIERPSLTHWRAAADASR